MSNAFFRIVKKWYRMFRGTSILHIEQGIGNYYEKGSIKGYYSDLRHKEQGHVDDEGIPYSITNYGDRVYFCITIFQYGLGSYDLYLETQEPEYLDKMKKMAEWAVSNQNTDGSWDAFSFSGSINPYSSMAQSEGASLLLRAYIEYKERKYFLCAEKAIDFMLLSTEKGGTAVYKRGGLALKEFADKGLVLNGWIFSIWGLYEYTIIEPVKEYQTLLQNTIDTLEDMMQLYDNGYWSYYDLDRHIASPFYHNLHIAQLEVMYDLFSKDIFRDYAVRWKMNSSRKRNRYRAIIKKGIQKLKEVNQGAVLVE